MIIWYLAQNSFRKLLREKILYNILGVTVLLIFFGFLASKLVFGYQDRVMIDFGYFFASFSIFAAAVGIGSRSFSNEIEDRTLYLCLTRPLSRTEYYFGRFLGYSLFILMNLILLAVIVIAMVKISGGTINLAFIQAFLLAYVESLVLLSGALLFSFWLRPALVLMLMLSFLFFGHNHEMISEMDASFRILNLIFPNLGLLVMSDKIFYGDVLSVERCAQAVFYAFCWISGFLLLGNMAFSRKNL